MAVGKELARPLPMSLIAAAMNLYFQLLLLTVSGWVNRHQQSVIEYLRAENHALREQLGSKRIRWTNAQRRLLAEKARAVGRAALTELGPVVTPDTLLRWYRRLVAAKYDGSKHRKPGRPRTKTIIANLVVSMARDNPKWGYTRLRGALHNLGHDVARNTVKRILLERGLEPAPERGWHTSWATFLRTHLGSIAGADFFTVEVLRPFGLVRYFVFFVIDIGPRRVQIAGISKQPSGAWMTQIARNLTEYFDGFLRGKRYLILDRDPLYTRVFRSTLAASGVKVVRLPSRSPNLNAFSERFVLSVKSECLDRVIPLGERHLRHLLAEYVAHYHTERNHQSLGNELIEPIPANTNAGGGVVRRRARLGGLLSYYYREAA
jgi:Integrase core domain